MKEKDKESSFASSAEASADKKVSEDKEKQLEECQKQKEEYLAGWQRARADLLNYKKEEMERIGQLMSYATEELILKMLPILDNFEIAEKNLNESFKNDSNPEGDASRPYGAGVKGVLQIKNQILDFLKSQGVEEIKSAGEKFDPNLHEVVEEVEPFDSAQGKEIKSGTIVEEIQKGYKINGRLLRAARVKVSK